MDTLTLLLVLGVVILAGLGAFLVWMGIPRGPSLEKIQHLTTPHLVEMSPQKVLQVRAKGDPNVVGKKAFGLVMKSYFRLKGVPKGGPSFQPPRARWPVNLTTPHEEWEGLYAMPVPESVKAAPPVGRVAAGLTVELTSWDYGTMAQVLHVGRWDREEPTVAALMEFIRTQGYVVAGAHEEEYLKGPGMLFRGDPDRYLTLIRYPVRREIPR
jgi:hypothetical protein